MEILKNIVLVSFLGFCISCTSPQAYLDKAVDIIQENSINKNSIDWVKLRKEVSEKGEGASCIKETYPAIQYALEQLEDNHSYLVTPEMNNIYNDTNLTLPIILSELINDSIGYIKIPGFMGANNGRANKFAQQIQDKIRELDKDNIQYWIVDLGDNTGGNMWPMLLGLGPILGDGTFGYIVSADSVYLKWSYLAGTTYYDENLILKLDNPYRLRKKIKKLAVLISNKTASSGEAIAISFKGAKNSCFIGEPTYGISTCFKEFKLSDGAIINLVATKFADRNKKIYGVPINPDIVDSYWTTAKKTAIDWINKK